MADSIDGEVYWHSPDPRAVFPLYEIKTPKSVRQLLKKKQFEIKLNESFEQVVRQCAARDDSWISEEIVQSYLMLHELGYTQSVEAYRNGELVGGLYGVSIGGAFFGESMFFLESNASKVSFYSLLEILRQKGFLLLDSQYINDFTAQLGAVEIPKYLYMIFLANAISLPVSFR